MVVYRGRDSKKIKSLRSKSVQHLASACQKVKLKFSQLVLVITRADRKKCKFIECRRRNKLIEEQSKKVQAFFISLDENITDLLEVESDDINEQAEQLTIRTVMIPTMQPIESFENSNDTRWGSTQVMLKSRRENEGNNILLVSQGSTVIEMDDSMDHRMSLLAEFAQPATAQESEPAILSVREQINEYFEEAKTCAWNTQILNWWSTNERKFPVLAKLARLVLSFPATSASPESAFSIGSCAITAKRSQISPFNAAQVLFAHDNFDFVQNYLLD